MFDLIALLICFTTFIPTQSKLYQVVTVLSPGARYHLNDIYDGSSTKNKWGEITPVGLRQQQSLGKYFRKDYIDLNGLMSKNFVKDEYELITKNLSRNIQSGLANLYGMYGRGNGQKLEPAQNKYHFPPYAYNQDIKEPVFALPEGQLIKVVSFNSALLETCPNQKIEIEKNIRIQLPDYNEMVLTYNPFLKKMANMFKIDLASMNFTKLASLYDTLQVDRYLGRKLPADFSQADLQNMQHLYNWYNHFIYTFNLSKALNTFTFNEILKRFDQKIKAPKSHFKWLTISAEQKDIINLQTGLNISSALCIEQIYRKGETSALNCQGSTTFASSIVFELHSDNEVDFQVRVRNNGKYINLCGAKQNKCDYNVFKGNLKAGVVNDPLQICGKQQAGKNQDLSVLIE